MVPPNGRLNEARWPWLFRQCITIGLSAGILCGARAHAQLTFGADGNGGSGAWNTTTVDWFNGSTAVPWTNGSSAIFAGTGGTVTSVFPGPTVSDITFNSPGYTIQSGWINSSTATFNIVTNQAATSSSTLNYASSNGTLVKSGAATLTVAGTNFFSNVQVNQGEYLVSGSSSLFFSNVTLANSPGVVVTLGQTSNFTDINSLSGGGSLGGVLQPNATARTVTATLWDNGTFNGVAQDNGSGKLALTLFARSRTATFTGTNTYSGATLIEDGTFALSQNGSIPNSAVTTRVDGTLQLDNSGGVLADRISDTLDLTMKGGQINFIGNSATAVEEVTGNLKFSGADFINNSQPGAAASLLTFSGATRGNHATINFAGNGRTKWVGMANDASGIVGAYATAGNEWAIVGGDGRVDALSTYATNINTAGSTEHVKLTGGGTTTLAASGQRATLNFQNSSGSTGTLDIGAGQALTLGEGGILSSGTAASQIQNGTLSAGSTGELIVTNQNALTISSGIGESVAGTGLTKSGAGTLTLSGTNTYSGITAINQGTLQVSSDANLGTGSTIEFAGGTLAAAQSFSSTKGFTNPIPQAGVVNTGSFNVVFSGTNTGAISKTGTGTLTLSNPAPGTVDLEQGILNLSNPTSGSITLAGGTLLSAGNLSSLSLLNSSTLDIGGAGAATLATQQFSTSGGTSAAVTVRFDLGLSSSDLWTIGSSFAFPTSGTPVFLFDFQNLGGVAAGQDYTLMNIQSGGGSLTSSMFGLAPSAVTAGWNGTFNVTPTQVTVHLTATPEPSATLLLALGALGLGHRRRRRTRGV